MYQRGSTEASYNGQAYNLMTFLRIISCHSRQPTISPSFIIRRIPLRLSTTKFINLSQGSRFHIKNPLNIIQRLVPFIHTILKGLSILSQGISYSYSYIYKVRDTTSSKQDTTFFTLSLCMMMNMHVMVLYKV